MDPTDYAGNSKRDKEKADKDDKPEKNIKKVVSEAVTVKKKGFGRRLKDSFIEADVRTVISYIVAEKVIPGAKNIILDSIYNGFERMFFPGETRSRPGGQQSRISYSGISRAIGGSPLRNAPRLERGPRSTRQQREEFVIPSKKEAEEILELMNDVIDGYDVVTLAEYYEMVDQPISPVDQKWGWSFLGDVGILQVRGGYLIDLPPAEPIQ